MKPLSLIEKAFFLKKVRLFAELDFDLLLAVAEQLHDDDYHKDEHVFVYNQAANRIYLIVQGSVQILDSKMRPLAELADGDFFGDESLFNEQARGYEAICKKDTHLLTLSRSHLLSVISECPCVAVSLLQLFAQQIPCRFSKLDRA